VLFEEIVNMNTLACVFNLFEKRSHEHVFYSDNILFLFCSLFCLFFFFFFWCFMRVKIKHVD
jgi:hypothetical protein